jgi:hypothetical protein
MSITTEQMRIQVRKAYPGKKWRSRVDFMSDAQVIAIWKRLHAEEPNRLRGGLIYEPIYEGTPIGIRFMPVSDLSHGGVIECTDVEVFRGVSFTEMEALIYNQFDNMGINPMASTIVYESAKQCQNFIIQAASISRYWDK